MAAMRTNAHLARRALLLAAFSASAAACRAEVEGVEREVAVAQVALSASSDDARSVDADVVVGLANVADPEIVCTGVLLTPTVVLTARACVAADRAGARPVVLVGARRESARGHLAARDAVALAGPGEAVTPGADALALVFLDPDDPATPHARVSHPMLALPAGVALTGDPATLGGGRLVAATWGAGTPTPSGCSTAGARQAVDLSLATFEVSDVAPFWLRSSDPAGRALSEGDLGSPLLWVAADGARQVIGVAADVEPTSADRWVRLGAEDVARLLRATLRRVDGPTWRSGHPPIARAPDGGPDWWIGETGHQGPCRWDDDPDCDQWLDNTPDGSGDNCPSTYNPDQLDADDDGIGDACDCAAELEAEARLQCATDLTVAAGGRRIRAIAAHFDARAPGARPTAAGKALVQDLWSRVDEAQRILERVEDEVATGDPQLAEPAMAELRRQVRDLVSRRSALTPAAGLSPLGLDTTARAPACAMPARAEEAPDARTYATYGGLSQDAGWGRGSMRFVGDVDGDGRADLAAIGEEGVEVALSDGARFLSAGLWSRTIRSDVVGDDRKTALVDMTGDGLADIVTATSEEVFLAASTGTEFLELTRVLAYPPNSVFRAFDAFGQLDLLFGDVTGDRRADLVALVPSIPEGSHPSAGGVYVAEFNGIDLDPLAPWSRSPFGAGRGAHDFGRNFPRALGDVDGDGRADLVGFGTERVWVSLATNGAFQPESEWSSELTDDRLYFARYSPRLLADVDGDGKADIIGVTNDSLAVAEGRGGVMFAPSLATRFGPIRLWSRSFMDADVWSETWFQPRVAADVDGDGAADITGFGTDGVYTLFALDGARP